MKKISLVNRCVLLLTILLVFVSCSSFGMQDEMVCYEVSSSTKSGELVNPNLLTYADITAYCHYLSIHESTKSKVILDISPVVRKGVTVYYVINFDKGWRLLSADKRGPIVLAESEEGQFNQDEVNEEEGAWLDAISDQIISRITRESETGPYDNETITEKEQKCLDFWSAITCEKSFLLARSDSKLSQHRYDSLYLTNAYDVVIEYESVDHLIPVYWHQDAPFNTYCPLISENSSTRCPAGCVALSASQTLYYLHYHMGSPNNSPSSGSCTGWIGNYTQTFSNFISTTWDNMEYSTDTNGYAALLIGYMGKMLNMNYGPTGSSAFTSDIPFVFGSCFGINSTYSYFNSNTAYNCIASGYPVICRASSSGGGHSFIIDGYVTSVTETHYEYTLPSGQIAQEVVLSSPYLTAFRINWGWGLYGRNATYQPDGTWLGFDNSRSMVYNFMTENK